MSRIDAERGVVLSRRPDSAFVRLDSGVVVRVRNGLVVPPSVGARVLVGGSGKFRAIVSRRR